MTEEKIDPRTKRTRQLLIKAFEELLGEKSFEAITVQDIADRATVNRATFYAHFEDKFDLIDQAFDEAFAQALHKNVPPGSEFSPTNVQLLIQTICEFMEQLHGRCETSSHTQIDSRLEQQVRFQLRKVLLEWVKTREDLSSSRQDAELRATITSWAIYGACVWWSQGERKESAQEFPRRVLPLIMAGLEPEGNLGSKAAQMRHVQGYPTLHGVSVAVVTTSTRSTTERSLRPSNRCVF
ncbi:MAG: TetR/AcrR family transcriptional regulator [Chloroflexi bacterium]|nr:TetR/AcrR family transcriptional regulator [Chloroflexota bacterium]